MRGRERRDEKMKLRGGHSVPVCPPHIIRAALGLLWGCSGADQGLLWGCSGAALGSKQKDYKTFLHSTQVPGQPQGTAEGWSQRSHACLGVI